MDNPNPDSLRLVTDMRKLNDVVKRPRIYFPGTREVWQKVKPNSKKFASFDLKQGYHQLKIAEESKNLFGFLLEQGQFKYCSAPQGFCASGDEFNSATDHMLSDMPNITKEVDDCMM